MLTRYIHSMARKSKQTLGIITVQSVALYKHTNKFLLPLTSLTEEFKVTSAREVLLSWEDWTVAGSGGNSGVPKAG